MTRPYRLPTRSRIGAAALAALMVFGGAPLGWTASHREAPIIALDPAADITDVYAFRSWEDPSKAVFIMNVIPSQVPASGPNFYNFDDEVVYALHLDLNADGDADDAIFEFRFHSGVRVPFDDLPVSYAGVDPVPGLPPAITALHGPGSEGLGLRQKYSVRILVRSNGVTRVFSDESVATNGDPLVAVPSNVGVRTMPNYPALAAKGIFGIAGNAIRVFAGQRKETFSIDLASAFDTLNFRRNPPVLTDAEDAMTTTATSSLQSTPTAIIPTRMTTDTTITAPPARRSRSASSSRSGSRAASSRARLRWWSCSARWRFGAWASVSS